MTSNSAGNAESPDCCLQGVWQDNGGLAACRAHLPWEDKAGMLLSQPVGYPASTWGSRKAGSPTHSAAALVCQPVAKGIREKSWKCWEWGNGKGWICDWMQCRGCVRGVCDSYRSHCPCLNLCRKLSWLPSHRTCFSCMPPGKHCSVFYCSWTKEKALPANQCQQVTKASVVSLQHAEPFTESTVNPGLWSLSLERHHIHAETASDEATSLETA